MASFIIAGKADDPAFARVEYAAKQIEAACPNVFFAYEMKHPDAWKEFIVNVFKQYDFHGFNDDFSGPLVWTHEGELIGGGAEFVQRICIEKFGIKDPPSMSDPMFKQIASDNYKQVRQQLFREHNGLPLSEKVEAANERACGAGLVQAQCFDERRRIVASGASVEVWVSSTLDAERAQLRETFTGAVPVMVDPGLKVCTAGQDMSHAVLLHPRPIARKQVVLVPERLITEPPPEVATLPAEAAPEETIPAASFGEGAVLLPPGESAAGSEVASALPDAGVAPAVQAPAPPMLTVQPRCVSDSAIKADLSLLDFTAAMEVLTNVSGIATWSGLWSGSEYRHPLDTHLQVLSYPLHSQGDSSPLRFPLELAYDWAIRENQEELKVFPFKHAFCSLAAPEGTPDDRRKLPKVLSQVALDAYESIRLTMGRKDASCMLAFTTSWLLYVPLDPAVPGTPRHEAWLQMPPPPPCALCGVVISPSVAKGYPETAGCQLTDSADGKKRFISTRAEQENIPEGSPEFEAASREVRIATGILDYPTEIIGIWVATKTADDN